MSFSIVFNGSKACLKIYYKGVKRVLIVDAKDAIKKVFDLVNILEAHSLDAIIFYEKYVILKNL